MRLLAAVSAAGIPAYALFIVLDLIILAVYIVSRIAHRPHQPTPWIVKVMILTIVFFPVGLIAGLYGLALGPFLIPILMFLALIVALVVPMFAAFARSRKGGPPPSGMTVLAGLLGLIIFGNAVHWVFAQGSTQPVPPTSGLWGANYPAAQQWWTENQASCVARAGFYNGHAKWVPIGSTWYCEGAYPGKWNK